MRWKELKNFYSAYDKAFCVTLNDLDRYKYNPILSISLLRAVKGKAKRITLFRGNKEYKQLNILQKSSLFFTQWSSKYVKAQNSRLKIQNS